jgi:hypothetical protein
MEGEIVETTTPHDVVTDQTLSNCGYKYDERAQKWMKPWEVGHPRISEPVPKEEEAPPPQRSVSRPSTSNAKFQADIRASLE